MKYLRTIWLILTVILLSIGITACKNDDENTCCDPTNPECPNYDPCHAEIETSADFKILQGFGIAANDEWREEPYFYGGQLKFSAIDTTAASYTWYLGVDTFTNVQDVTLGFGNLPNGTYGAALVVEKTPNLSCFPGDTGRDSLYQTFTKIDNCDPLVFGKFRGLLDSATDSTTIEIRWMTLYFEPCAGSLYCINFLNDGDTLLTSRGPFSYTKLSLNGNGSGDPKGILTVNPENNEVDLEFRFEFIDHTFKGVKIQ